jgi:hypothetical protein
MILGTFTVPLQELILKAVIVSEYTVFTDKMVFKSNSRLLLYQIAGELCLSARTHSQVCHASWVLEGDLPLLEGSLILRYVHVTNHSRWADKTKKSD